MRVLTRLTPIAALLLAASLSLPAVLAANHEARPEAESWALKERILDLDWSAAGFQYDSSRPIDSEGPIPPGTVEDRITAAYLVQAATLELAFASFEPGTETSIDATLAFTSLIEFVDRDGDGRYDAGDEVVQRIALPGHSWTTFSVEPALTDGHRATVRYTLNATGGGGLPIGGGGAPNPGVFETSFVVAPAAQTLEGNLLRPTEIHIDWKLDRFPHKANGTLVALETKISSSKPFGSEPDRFRFGTELFDGVYRWGTNGLVPAGLGVTVLSDPRGNAGGSQQTMLFSFARQQTVQHDASLGVVRYEAEALPGAVQEILDGDWRLYLIGILLSAAVVGGSAFARLRRD